MINASELRRLKEEGLVGTVNLKKYIDENREAIDRYSISEGKVKYDLSQSRLINDVIGISINAAKQVATGTKSMLWDNAIKYDGSLSLEEQLKSEIEQMNIANENIKETMRPYKEAARIYREDIDRELGNETSGTQSFVAGMAIHTLRQGLDVRQWPGLYAASLVGGPVGQAVSKIAPGLKPAVAKGIGKAVSSAVEEMIEEAVDQSVNYDEFDALSIIESGAGAAILSGVVIPGMIKGSKKVSQLVGVAAKNTDEAIGKASKILKKEQNEYVKKVMETGSEAAAKVEDLNGIAESTEAIAEMKGKNVSKKSIIEAGATIEGVTIKEAKEIYMPRVADYMIEKKIMKNIDTPEKLLKAIEENPKAVKKAIRQTARRKDLLPEQMEAFQWFEKVLDEKRIKDIDVDVNATTKASADALNEKVPYEPVFKEETVIEKGYPFTESEIDLQAFNERAKVKGKHNYKDYKKSQLKEEIAKDLNIPKGAKIKSVNGEVPKTPYKVKSNMDADGNPVYIRNKWEHGRPTADIEWEDKGYRYFANVEVIEGKWRGDIYKTKIDIPGKVDVKKKTKVRAKPETVDSTPQNPKVMKPDNVMEDIYGRYETDEVEKAMWDDAARYVIKRFGLQEKASEAKDRVKIMTNISRAAGEVARKKYNFKSLDEAIDFYKKKYGLEFEFKKGTRSPETRGEAFRIKVDGKEIVGRLAISEEIMDDLDLSIGVLRHEIEHFRDFKDNPYFKSSPYRYSSGKEGETLAEYFARITKGHFSKDAGGWYELNYIIHNEINGLFSDGKLDKVTVERLGLDMIPKKLDEADVDFIKGAIVDGQGDEAVKRLKNLKTQLSNYFTIKRGLKDIYYSELTPAQKAASAKEYLRTNLILPFNKAEEQMRNTILKSFEIDSNGNILSVKEVLDLFEENKGNLIDVLFYDGEMPKELGYLNEQIAGVKTKINKIIDDLQEKSIASRDDIINTLSYDRNLTLEKYLSEEEISKFLDSNKNLDTEKFLNGRAVKDTLTGKNIPERAVPVIDRFIQDNFSYFNSSVDRLHHEFNRKKLSPQKIISAIREARECMTLKDFENTLKKYKAETIPEVKNFLETHKELFQEIADRDIEQNLINSKKNNAKRFFLEDMQSKKGTEDNPARGTFAHKLSRFVDAEYEGYISHRNVSNFVRANKANQRLITSKMVRDISAAHAIKETFPKMGNTGFNVMFEQIQKGAADSNAKTFVGEIEGFIKDELGEKLGLFNNPSKGLVDRIVLNTIRYQNAINLSGPKAIKELGQEPISMARANRMLYGGKGFVKIYGDIIKAEAIIMQNGEELAKINSILGSKWKDSIPLEFFNIIQDDLNDFAGYRQSRIAKYGSKTEKAMLKIDRGLEIINLYSHTQRMMKLAAYFTAGDTMDNLTKAKNLDELFKNQTRYTQRLFKDLEIDNVEYELIKGFKETNSFKRMNMFDEVEFSDNLTPEKYSNLLGREVGEEEFKILRDSTTKKAKRLYEKIVSDISPTETTGATRAVIDSIKDPVRRNFMRLTGNFKNSIQEQWRRIARDYYYSNLIEETGKFDWSNKVYQKRLMSNLLGTGMAIAAISTISDPEFYVDPIETISEKIDNMIEEPGSVLWSAVSDNLNIWGLTTGSNVIRRPISFAGQVSKGEWDKAAETLIKAGIGTTNYDIGKFIYEDLF